MRLSFPHPLLVRSGHVESTGVVNYLMSDKGEILRVNTTTAIGGGPISGFLVVIVVSHIQCKKGLASRKKYFT